MSLLSREGCGAETAPSQFAARRFVEEPQQALQLMTPTGSDAPGVPIVENEQIGAGVSGQQDGLALTERFQYWRPRHQAICTR